MSCYQCPRSCGANRSLKYGYCAAPERASVARAALHFWEEPAISGKNGSGTIFFTGCSLRCIFCQNSDISRGDTAHAKLFDAAGLCELFKRLEGEGAHNINLVNPTHYAAEIMAALDIYRPSVPIVYNTGGYDSVQTLKRLEGYVDIYLPDFKYADNELAMRLSKAKDYPEVAFLAIKEMLRQTGAPVCDEQGIMQKGTLIRHLILPSHVMNTFAVLRKIKELGEVPVSIMAQYTPVNDLKDYPDINRRLNARELERVYKYAEKLGVQGYIQSLESASEAFIPDFDGTGL